MKLNGYEKVIIRDVESKDYRGSVLTLKITFILVFAIFILIYFYGFYGDFISNFKYLKTVYYRSVMTLNEDFKSLIYTYNKTIVLVIFISIFVLFLCFAFFAFDIVSRNRVIKYYQDRLKDSLDSKSNNAANDDL